MKKMLLPLLFCILIISCNKNKEVNSSMLRLNYFTSLCAGAFLDLTCYHYQVDQEIGSNEWRMGTIYIPNFDYVEGYIYDLEVIITPNDITNCADDCPENDYELLKIISKVAVENPCLTSPMPDRVCTLDYTPVCGCNGQTYGNACAASTSGVTSWTLGACN
jgi:hypothetical protein